MYKQETIQPTIIIIYKHFSSSYLSDPAPPTHTHTKTKERPPSTGRRVSTHDRQRGRAWFRPPTRPANPLQHPSSRCAGHQTAGTAAPPVRVSTNRPLAGPRAQDREREMMDHRAREGFRTRERENQGESFRTREREAQTKRAQTKRAQTKRAMLVAVRLL